MTDSHTPAAPAGSRRPLWILIGLFFAPLVAAFALYYGMSYWRPAGQTNHGDLITPARPLPQDELLAPDDQPLDADFLRGKWSLLYIGDGRCDDHCRQALTWTRQTRLALNDDLTRVQRVFFVTANCCDLSYLEQEHPGLITARVDEQSDHALLDLFPGQGAAAPQRERIYIVDPLGNLMMSHPVDAKSKGLLEDLKKLLKLSHIG